MPLLLRKDDRCSWRDRWLGVCFLSCVPNLAAGAAQSPSAPLDSALTQREEFCPLSHQPSLLQLCLLLLVIHSSPNLCSGWELTGLSSKQDGWHRTKPWQSQHIQMTHRRTMFRGSAVGFMGWTPWSPQGEFTLLSEASTNMAWVLWTDCWAQACALQGQDWTAWGVLLSPTHLLWKCLSFPEKMRKSTKPMLCLIWTVLSLSIFLETILNSFWGAEKGACTRNRRSIINTWS